MSDKNDPLDRVESAREEEYIRRQEQQRLEKLRVKMKRDEDLESLRTETGFTDAALLEELAALGVSGATVGALALVPLLQVAWADGEVQPDEQDLLLAAAKEAGLTAGPARALFDSLMETRPAPALYEGALRYIVEKLRRLPPAEASKAATRLAEQTHGVAKASGGLLGIFGRVDDAEKVVLRQIGERLREVQPAAAEKLLKRL